jgi:HD-GYP domain-containing protein (c-di-GMP phosphodiesterase class II)
MRYVSIEKAQKNMVLARPIFNQMNRVLLGYGTILTQEYIGKLKRRGFPGVYIEDELAKDIEVRDAITQELRNDGVDALRKGDIDAALVIAERIVDQMLANAPVSVDMVDLRNYDDYTYRHSVNVAVLSTVIGMHMGFTKGYLKELCIAALLHDIGKQMLYPEILNKPGFLTEDEFEHIKEHPQMAYDILKQRMDISAKVRTSVLSHHENEDGSGYPHGLKGNQIFIFAKIIHVADVFDALTSRRPYKQPYAKSEAVEYLMGNCGRLFDTKVVEAFISSISVYPKGTEVLLSDGRSGIVAANRDSSLRPVVRLFNGEEVDLNDYSTNRNVIIVPEFDVVVV